MIMVLFEILTTCEEPLWELRMINDSQEGNELKFLSKIFQV